MDEPHVVTGRDAFRAAARASLANPGDAATKWLRVPVEVRLEVSDPFDAYRRAREGNGNGDGAGACGAFLETTGGQAGWGYFGVDPVEVLTVGPDAVTWEDGRRDSKRPAKSGTGSQDPIDSPPTPEYGSPTLEALEARLSATALARGDCDVPYPCGLLGWLSYDVARELEELPGSAVDDRGLPRLEVGVFDRVAAWECPVEGDAVSLRIVACPRVSTDLPDDDLETGAYQGFEDILDRAYDRGRARALELADRIREGDAAVGPPPVRAPEATFESTCGRGAFADRVRRVKEYVHDGDTFQANISQRLVAPAAVHPVEAYEALRTVNPAPYSGLLEFRSADLVSASPELLIERDGDFLRTEPIAGTRPRGETTADDEAFEADLLADEKERAEHAMLVDLERNDMGKVCTYGSVDVAEYRRVDRYSEVMHLVSNIVGTLHADVSLAETIAATFPGGTITGAPKPRTMEIIDELEATQRGPYTGGIGCFGFDGRATMNIVIRTLVHHDREYHLRVGAGIVHDSDPHREYDETLAKARALLNAIDAALGERAMLALEADAETDGGVDDG